jgi:hypothetical protein
MDIATADELRSITEDYIEVNSILTKEEKIKKWLKWYTKRIEKMLEDTLKRGVYELTLPLPYQPEGNEDIIQNLYPLARKVKRDFVGCDVAFIEVEVEKYGVVVYELELEISWYPKKITTTEAKRVEYDRKYVE